jgi:hypothetical protein
MSFSIDEKNVLFNGEKVAVFAGEDEKLTMSNGKADMRPAVEAWMEEQGITGPGAVAAKPAEEPKAEAPAPKAEKPAVTKGVPPMPEMDPRLGDKTPAVVEWYFKHQPKEAAARYEGRKVERR